MKFVLFTLLILSTFLPVLIFYILDRVFNLKIGLVRLFKTTKIYKTTILLISLSGYLLSLVVLYLVEKTHLFFMGFSIIFLYHYLIHIPDTALNLNKTDKKTNDK
ncbi:hypothetical protein SAMN05660472_00766 [Natronincola ferrireducens]|uniref:Uncharacterized protein n=1 Tax=Natronincola ferrireducens TaxID=393762 RepID=A0A1G8Z7X3_9FIRM|nr:hypothetical protein SAMN05660472_00766 [Natronincola ferrireducens]